ncbi:MAG TPA: signal peptide peptidase SppA [Steroidobacteraceae bacterium]|nr:signal peptide peptidase SppA [Steroidobacteraceae bacterium]
MKFLGRVFRFIWHGLDGLRKVLHLIVLLVTFGIILVALSPKTPIIPSKAVLVVDPQGALVEQLTGGPIDRAVAEASGRERAETLLRDLVEAIDTAKDDQRIQAILIDPTDMTSAGLSKLEEVALALQRFRASGKPVIAAGENFDQAQYYLAAQADEIYLDPKGLVFIDGFGYYRMFLKDAIDKLGVDVNVFRAGKFKSFTDQYSRNDMSAQEREEASTWLNALWNGYQSAVVKARKLQPTALADYVQQIVPAVRKSAGNLAAVAVEQGLVTELKTRQQVEQRLMSITGEDDDHSFYGVHFDAYVEAEHPRHALHLANRKKIGVVVASGEILDGRQPPGSIGGDSTAELLKQARFDDDIKAVVLRIDSPGGSVFASEVIRREMELLKAAGKPVIASMSSTAASGGYYISMNADEIWASPNTLTGSIGVFAVLPTIERTLAKLGVHTDGIGTTPLAGGFNIERSLTADQRELLQLSVDHEYRQFIELVADARSKSPEQIDAIAQGRVWAGSDAQERGLVDKLGSFQDAVDAAATRAKLGKEYRIEYVEAQETWRQFFVNEVHSLAARAEDAIAPERAKVKRILERLTPLETELRRLARFSDPRHAYYYCVCTVE